MKRGLLVLLVSIFSIACFPNKVHAAQLGKVGEKYKKVQVYKQRKNLSSINEGGKLFNEEEIRQIRESERDKENYEVLLPKTKDNYEVAISYEDGSYTFAGSRETYEEAVAMAKVEENSNEVRMAGQIAVPTVINSYGEVQYSTESIGRVWKNYESTHSDATSLSYVYTDSSMKTSYTYINDSFISEVPIIQENAREAKVLVAGYKGWMNKDISRTTGGYSYNNRDLRIQPITDVTNPSYYIVKNGVLIHFISTSMSTNGSGTTRRIGVAPSYLKEGKTYYSYDGHYFYDGSNGTASALRTLTKDLQRNSTSNAVNSNNPYYNYFNYLPFRSRTSHSAAELNNYINSVTTSSSKLRGTGQYFINAQEKYGVNALLALGVAMNESAMGTSSFAINNNNLFGINATDDHTSENASKFSSVESCINEFAKYLISKGYSNPADWRDYGGFLGNKEFGANVYYASDPYWSEKAANFAFQIDYGIAGGNINAMKDYNKEQLLLHNQSSSVYDSSNDILYKVLNNVSESGSHIGGVATFNKSAAININGKLCYAINPEITSKIGSFDGNYNWNVKGYVPANTVKLINNGKNYFDKEDFNWDTKIDVHDLSLIAQYYNKTSSSNGWNSAYDMNNDGIVDIYDIVIISSKLS